MNELVKVPHAAEVFIASQWQQSRGTASLVKVISAHSEEVVCELPDASIEDAAYAVQQAKAAFDQGEWPRVSVEQRLLAVTRFRDGLANMEGFEKAWAIEGGMPITTVKTMYGGKSITRVC